MLFIVLKNSMFREWKDKILFLGFLPHITNLKHQIAIAKNKLYSLSTGKIHKNQNFFRSRTSAKLKSGKNSLSNWAKKLLVVLHEKNKCSKLSSGQGCTFVSLQNVHPQLTFRAKCETRKFVPKMLLLDLKINFLSLF